MKIPYNILIQIKMSVRPYFKGFTLIFFFYNCRKQDYVLSRIPIPFIILIKINMILFFVLSPFTNYLVPIARIVAAFIVTRITPGAFISLRSILSSLSVSFASGAHAAELRMPCFLILSSLINISR